MVIGFPYKEYTDFGTGLPVTWLTPMKSPSGNIQLPEENTVSLAYCRMYHLQFDAFLTSDQTITETMVAVIPEGSSQPIQYQVFDLAKCRETGDFSWSFITPRYGSSRLKLVFLNGKSLYGSAVYQNVKLSTAPYA